MKTPKNVTGGCQPPPPCSASYRGYIHVLHGEIWEEHETLDLTKSDGLANAFTVAMAKCQEISKRSGLQTRVMFVCEPNAQDDSSCSSFLNYYEILQ